MVFMLQFLERVAGSVTDHNQASIAGQIARALRPQPALARWTSPDLLLRFTHRSVSEDVQDLIHESHRLSRLRIDNQTVLADISPAAFRAVTDLS